MPSWSLMFLQDSNSPSMFMMNNFHDYLLLVTLSIAFYILINSQLLINNSFYSDLSEMNEMELFWTFLPFFILIMVAFPSLKILYFFDETFENEMTLMIQGNQWYWTYNLTSNYSYSNMQSNYLTEKMISSLMTNQHIILPILTSINILVTSTDVLHSWTIPSMGLKADATPGRLNTNFLVFNRPGVASGQCSEICGMNHSLMPIFLNLHSF